MAQALSADAHRNAALRVALERAIDALLAAIAHRRGEPAPMPPEEAQKTWIESCAVFQREGEWPFSNTAPWVAQSDGKAAASVGAFKSQRLLVQLTEQSLRVAFRCGFEAIQALRNHRLGMPTDMSVEEAEHTWHEANQILRNFEAWTFPEYAGLNWPGAQKDSGKCDKLN